LLCQEALVLIDAGSVFDSSGNDAARGNIRGKKL